MSNTVNYVQHDPAKIKEEPEFRILAYTRDAIPRADGSTLSIVDVVQKLILRDRGDSGDAASGWKTDAFNDTRDVVSKRMAAAIDGSDWEELLTQGQRDRLTNDPFPGVSHWSVDWNAQQEFDAVVGLEYLELSTKAREGAESAVGTPALNADTLAGFALRPTLEPQNCVLKGDAPGKAATGSQTGRGAPQGNPDFPDLTFKVTRGEFPPGTPLDSNLYRNRGWETILPWGKGIGNGRATGIQLSRELPNATGAVESEEELPPNAQFALEITWEGEAQGQSNAAGIRYSWGRRCVVDCVSRRECAHD